MNFTNYYVLRNNLKYIYIPFGTPRAFDAKRGVRRASYKEKYIKFL
jgi:hypothetical protein